MKVCAIIAAGGCSERFGAGDKLFAPLGESCVIVEAVKPFLRFEQVTSVLVGARPSCEDAIFRALKEGGVCDERIRFVAGGDSRTATVKNCVDNMPEDCDVALVHDGARPFASEDLIARVLSFIGEYDFVQPVLSLADALLKREGATPVDRAEYALVQTPVAVKKKTLQKAYKNAQSAFYDDISLVKTLDNVKIKLVDGDVKNKKITFESDLSAPLFGCGYDIHRMTSGEGIALCGVKIKCPFKFVAHSDGDVPVHAVMDSILSALGERDIGWLYPVNDARYDGANSMDLLAGVMDIARRKGKKVNNVSVCIIAQQPIVAPYVSQMKRNLASALGVPESRVGISATTNEGVGDIGDGKAIAAYATTSLL